MQEWKHFPDGKSLVTRDGRKVRILCTDIKGWNPVVYAIMAKDGERVMTCDSNGRVGRQESNDDLFIDDSLMLSDLQKKVKYLMCDHGTKIIADNIVARETHNITSLVLKELKNIGATINWPCGSKEAYLNSNLGGF